MTAEINTSLIPEIIKAKKNLATKIGASQMTVTSGSVNYSEDCPKTEAPIQKYFAALNTIVNQYKGARFLYANDDLRDEYFGKPVSTFTPPHSFGSSELEPMCETHFAKMGETVTEEEVTKSFNDSQELLINYAIELNTSYQNIMDDFLRQKFSTSFNTSNIELLTKAGLWETTGTATGLEPTGDWESETLKEENSLSGCNCRNIKDDP